MKIMVRLSKLSCEEIQTARGAFKGGDCVYYNLRLGEGLYRLGEFRERAATESFPAGKNWRLIYIGGGQSDKEGQHHHQFVPDLLLDPVAEEDCALAQELLSKFASQQEQRREPELVGVG